MRHSSPSVAFLVAATSLSTILISPSLRAQSQELAAGTIAGMAGVTRSSGPNTARYKKKFVAAFTEYNTGTCAQIDQGEWTVTLKPDHGSTSFGTVTGPLGNGACSGHTYTFAAIYYEWTEHDNKADTDVIHATWKTKDGMFNYPEAYIFIVPIVLPIGETTMAAGWDGGRGLFQQKLMPPTDDSGFDFSGETVRETDAGTIFDSCGGGSARINGSEWPVMSGNTWGPDGVGYGANVGQDRNGACAIEYYRCVKRTPCGFGLRQQMQIHAPPEPGGSFTNYGGINVLASTITGSVLPFTPNKIGTGFIRAERSGVPQATYYLSTSVQCVAGLPACR